MSAKFYYSLLLPIVFFWSCKEDQKSNRERFNQANPHETVHQVIDIKDTSLQQFIPMDYRLIFQVNGDVTKDGIADDILVLGGNKEAVYSDFLNGKPLKRKLVILSTKEDGSKEQVFISDKIIECIDCSGMVEDAFKHIEINKDGSFTVHHEIMKEQFWKEDRTFQYDATLKDWFLTKDYFISYRDEVGEGNVKDLKKGHEIKETTKQFGKISLKNFDIYGKNRR